MGIVKIVKIGFTMLFRKARTTATKSALIKSFTSTPGNSHAVISTATEEIRILRMNFNGPKLPHNWLKPKFSGKLFGF